MSRRRWTTSWLITRKVLQHWYFSDETPFTSKCGDLQRDEQLRAWGLDSGQTKMQKGLLKEIYGAFVVFSILADAYITDLNMNMSCWLDQPGECETFGSISEGSKSSHLSLPCACASLAIMEEQLKELILKLNHFETDTDSWRDRGIEAWNMWWYRLEAHDITGWYHFSYINPSYIHPPTNMCLY